MQHTTLMRIFFLQFRLDLRVYCYSKNFVQDNDGTYLKVQKRFFANKKNITKFLFSFETF